MKQLAPLVIQKRITGHVNREVRRELEREKDAALDIVQHYLPIEERFIEAIFGEQYDHLSYDEIFKFYSKNFNDYVRFMNDKHQLHYSFINEHFFRIRYEPQPGGVHMREAADELVKSLRDPLLQSACFLRRAVRSVIS